MTVSSRSSPPRVCDVICGGTSPLRSSLPSGTRSPGSGGRACEETPRQPGGRREQNGSSASDAGFLQEPVRACFRPSCHPRHRHAHQQSHTERWDYRAQACSSKREGFEGINMSAPPPSLFTEELSNYFFFLQDVFSNEFIFVPGKSSQVVVPPFFSGW